MTEQQFDAVCNAALDVEAAMGFINEAFCKPRNIFGNLYDCPECPLYKFKKRTKCVRNSMSDTFRMFVIIKSEIEEAKNAK